MYLDDIYIINLHGIQTSHLIDKAISALLLRFGLSKTYFYIKPIVDDPARIGEKENTIR